MSDALKKLAEGVAESIAITADENRIGCDEDTATYERWHEALHIAVDDGLEMVERRANGLDL
jgi:hypothetical protein